jgi:hypothetical protein
LRKSLGIQKVKLCPVEIEMSTDEEITIEKQHYLRERIIEGGYDATAFTNMLESVKEDGNFYLDKKTRNEINFPCFWLSRLICI